MSRLSKFTHNELIKLAERTIIPPLSAQYYKGQVGGRVCVVGGSFKYSGAPFFAANATLLYGSDLTYMVCSAQDHALATILKVYSPNIMVNPILHDPHMDCTKFLGNVHSCVIGPGLGRREDDSVNSPTSSTSTIDTKYENVCKIIKYCIDHRIFVVIDADGLYLLSNDPKYKSVLKEMLSRDSSYIVLTPNVIEFKRLLKEYPNIYTMFPGLTIVEKGYNDLITSTALPDKNPERDSHVTLTNSVETRCLKRCGGQGDTLSGCLATQLGWCNVLMRDFEESGTLKENLKIWKERDFLKDITEYKMLSAYIATTIVKLASSMAFDEKKRSMQTTDLNNKVGEAFYKIFGDTCS